MAIAEGPRVTVIVYVSVVTPSCAVTTVVMVLGPIFKGKDGEAAPDATALPLMLTVSPELLINASALIDVVALDTVEV